MKNKMPSLYELVPDLPNVVIVDVGAMAMTDAPEICPDLVLRRKAKVIGFEPNVEECERLRRIYGPPHEFFPCILGQGGTRDFFITNRPMTSSLYEPNTEFLSRFHFLGELTEVVERIRVETQRLDDVGIAGPIDLLKIDVQGAELDVLCGGVKTLSQCSLVQVEVEFAELYHGQPLFADVDAWLREQGFAFHTFTQLKGRCLKPFAVAGDPTAGMRQILWGDAVYIRPLGTWAEIDTTQLDGLAMLLHDVYRSPDFCYAALAATDHRKGTECAERYRAFLASHH